MSDELFFCTFCPIREFVDGSLECDDTGFLLCPGGLMVLLEVWDFSPNNFFAQARSSAPTTRPLCRS